jgi:hypothetical protein
MPHLSRRGDKRVEMGPKRSPLISSHMMFIPSRGCAYVWTNVQMYVRNEHPYVMRREGYAPFGADARKALFSGLTPNAKKKGFFETCVMGLLLI